MLADDAEEFCSSFFFQNRKKPLLVIVGQYGSGKTHVARKIANYCNSGAMAAVNRGHWSGRCIPSATFRSWPELCNEFNAKDESSLQDLFNEDMLSLDDIGAENDPWKACSDKLCQVLSRRERMFTVITTNIAPQHWTEKFDGRIADRLMRFATVSDISAVPSYALR